MKNVGHPYACALQLGALALLGCSEAPPSSTPVEDTAIADYPSVAALAAQLDGGALSSVELVHELLERAGHARHLNAYITLDSDGALETAETLDRERAAGRIRGPLHGIPLVVKDNIHVAGLPNTAGTPGLREFVPGEHNPVIARLVEAGAIILGKTNLHELAFGITSDNAAFGAVANPFKPTHFAGGSSGGTASAISAGLAPAGLGTDTGGSARIPAALTGVVGFRPTTGRYPAGAVTPISHTRDTIGVLGRTVADVAMIDRAIIAPMQADATSLTPDQIVLGVPRSYFFDSLDDETATIVEQSLQRLRAAGITLVETRIPDLSKLVADSAFPIALYEVAEDLPAYLGDYAVGVSFAELAERAASTDVQDVLALVRGDQRVPREAYDAALEARAQMRNAFRDVFAAQQLDALVFPTTLLPSRPIADSMATVQLNGSPVPTFPTYIRNTDPASIAALPGISLPAGVTADGLPVGLEFDGPEGSDQRLLAVAAAVEAVLGFTATPSR